MSDKSVTIYFYNEDHAKRYFNRFNGISGANKIELGNKELEKCKAAYLVLKECNDFTINELNQEKINLHMMKQVDFCNREASKRAALILGEWE
jgi:hypothetical protein